MHSAGRQVWPLLRLPWREPLPAGRVAALKNCMENAHEGGVEMFVCHPGYLDAYILRKSSLTVPRAMEAEMLCSDETKKYIEEQGIELVTYDDLK